MRDKLKVFVSKNKQEFDSKEPKQDLWEKIDAKMGVKDSSVISINWLSKLKYFGLSASVLIVVVVYFISKNLNNSSANELAQNRKDSAISNSKEWAKANQNNSPTISENSSEGSSHSANKDQANDPGSTIKETNASLAKDTVRIKKDSIPNPKPIDNNFLNQNKINPPAIVHPTPKEEDKPIPNGEINKIEKSNKTETLIPPDVEKVNTYNGTIYESSFLCDILRAYKFPGQVSMDGTMRTTGCSRLESMTGMKAVWVKGKTNKKITLEVKEGFKNIKLVKSDGREVLPEAISHYYKGLGVITGYTGKNFYMSFKDKVELILFFKNVEEGDKIVIDETIETVVKNKP